MISENYLQDQFVSEFSSAFLSRKTQEFEGGARVSADVFPVAVWPQFLKEADCFKIRDELASMDFVLRSSDLYEFHQTVDLKHASPEKYPSIAGICSEIYSPEFLSVMERVTERKLGGHVDISGQRYQKGDFLLCHDDRLERRRIALVLYLVAPGAELEGGRLWAMRSDEEGRPVYDRPDQIVPKWNTLAFFEVTRSSFHQVSQVLNDAAPRYSLTCWFHDLEVDYDTQERVANEKPVLRDTASISGELEVESFMPEVLLADVINAFDGSEALPIFREFCFGKCISLAQCTGSEPDWMKYLSTPEFHKRIEQLSGSFLDWPSRPVAWCVDDSEIGFFRDTGKDRQGEVEYNYKERRAVLETFAVDRIHCTIVIKIPKGDEVKRAKTVPVSFMLLGKTPFKLEKLPEEFSKIIFISVKFNLTGFDLKK